MWSRLPHRVVRALPARLTGPAGPRARLLVLASVVLVAGLVALPAVLAQGGDCDKDTGGPASLADDDCDGLPNSWENEADLDPHNPDTDGDMVDDGTEYGDPQRHSQICEAPAACEHPNDPVAAGSSEWPESLGPQPIGPPAPALPTGPTDPTGATDPIAPTSPPTAADGTSVEDEVLAGGQPALSGQGQSDQPPPASSPDDDGGDAEVSGRDDLDEPGHAAPEGTPAGQGDDAPGGDGDGGRDGDGDKGGRVGDGGHAGRDGGDKGGEPGGHTAGGRGPATPPAPASPPAPTAPPAPPAPPAADAPPAPPVAPPADPVPVPPVAPPQAAGGRPALPVTGAHMPLLLGAGLVMVAVGGGALALGRRRGAAGGRTG